MGGTKGLICKEAVIEWDGGWGAVWNTDVQLFWKNTSLHWETKDWKITSESSNFSYSVS